MTMNALSQPETCDILIRNGYVLTLDRERRVFPSGAVAISGNAIVELTKGRMLDVGTKSRGTLRIIPSGSA